MSDRAIFASTASVAHCHRTLSELLLSLTQGGVTRIELGWAPPLAGLRVPEGLGAFAAEWLVHNYFPCPPQPFVLNLASQDPDTLARSREFATEALRLCAALRAPFYSVHCGFLAELDPASLGRPLTYSDLSDYETGYRTFLESLHQLLRVARQVGVRLLLEPNVVSSFNLIDGKNRLLLLAEPDEFRRLFADLSDPALGVLLDLGHLKVTAQTLGFGPDAFVETVASRIGAFHLHDNDGRSDQHRPVSADSWPVDVLRQDRFAELPVVVEAKFDDAKSLAEHCFWLKTLLNR